jgi:hypothetical protein
MVVAALAVGAKGMDSRAVAAQEAVGEVTVDSVVERLEMVEAVAQAEEETVAARVVAEATAPAMTERAEMEVVTRAVVA